METNFTTTADTTPWEEKLKTGDVLHYYRDNVFTRFVSFFKKPQWSQTAIFSIVEGHHCVLEYSVDGVNVSTFDNWVRDKKFEAHRLGVRNDRVFNNKAIQDLGLNGSETSMFLNGCTGYENMDANDVYEYCIKNEWTKIK